MTNEVTTTNQSLPSYLPKDIDTGTDTIGSEDVIIPRIKIVQAMSAIKDTLSVNEGQFYTADGTLIEDILECFVLLHWKSKVWFSEDQKLDGIEFTDAATKQRIQAGPKMQEILADPQWYASGDDCNNYMIVRREALSGGGVPTVYLYTAQGAANKYAKQLNSKLKANGRNGIPIYCQSVMMGTTKEKFNQGSAFMPQFTYGDFATEAEFTILKKMFDAAKEHQARTETTTSEEEVTVNADDVVNPI